MATTTVGVLFSVLLTNKCTLGKGAPTYKDCTRAVRMLCFDDCCCGNFRDDAVDTRTPLLGEAQSLSINDTSAADWENSNVVQHDMSRSRRASVESVALLSDPVASEVHAKNAALTEMLQEKARECDALRLRVVELERQLDIQQEETPTRPGHSQAPLGSE